MNTNDFELEEMRQQMAILQNKLNNQNIVNDRFIRRAIKHGMSTINKRYLVISIIALAMIPYGYWAFVVIIGLSLFFSLLSYIILLMVGVSCFFFLLFFSYNINIKNYALCTTIISPRAICRKQCAKWPQLSAATTTGCG